ncbi:uncharacterized protein EDB91DRAFT_1252276 [Suillus paluster]|uniref:uncharacterized protein n=1 Tax=Suillus paluster TaxID=48578 RepID=UPI001B87366F|nr:uncharacterized protein EDB91DRAFT_1252276 [Suillus paluster]KAG1731214.1 hypothetical protein EDB91DRAFT_1252276 [Suillus paluster]
MAIDPALRVPPRPVASTSAPTAGPSTISPEAQGPPAAAVPAVSSAAVAHCSNKGKDCALPSSEVDIHANPHYPSQLPPVFTQHYAEQEQQLKAMEHQAAEQRDLEHHTKNTVEAYGWSEDGAEVTMCEFQDGITLLQFKVTARVFRALGLYSGDDAEVQVQYFNTSKSRWCTVQQGHVLMLDSRQVYMCNIGVTITPEFDEIFESNSLHAVPNICTNLKVERAAVRLSNTRKQLRAASITASDSEEPEDMQKRKHLGHSAQGNTHRACTNTAGSSASSLKSDSPPLWDEIEIFSDSSSEVNITPHQHAPHPSHRRSPSLDSGSHSGSEVDITPRQHAPHQSRCRCSPSLDSGSQSDASTSDARSTSNATTISECSSLSSGHSPEDAVDVDAFDDVKRWPTSFYACEIADGFKKYNKSRRVGLSSHAAFSLAFGGGVHFHPSTFSEHRK